jgi:hypothetical protein
MDIHLIDAAIRQALFNRTYGTKETLQVQLFGASTGQAARVTDAIEERINLDRSLSRRRQRPHNPLAVSTQSTERVLIASQVLATILAFEILHADTNAEVLTSKIHDTNAEVLTSKVRVASSSFHLNIAVRDGEDGHVESASTYVTDEDVFHTRTFIFQAIRDRCGSGLITNARDVRAAGLASILCGLTLRIRYVRLHRR